MGSDWDPQNAEARPSSDDFVSSMDPLAKAKPQFTQKSLHAPHAKKFQDEGQTVGPVTLAEIEQVASKSSCDGSAIYNSKLVDKSKKSKSVQRAMEQRELQAQAMADQATREMRQREEQQKQMDLGKQQAAAEVGLKLKMWAEDNGRKKNIRTLLSTMHLVIWPNSKWKEASMAKLLNPMEVKKCYRRAMLVVHPDKNAGRTPTQVFIAERIFDAVNCAWDEFAAKEIA